MVMAKKKYDLNFSSFTFKVALPDSPWPSDERLVTTILFFGPWRQKQNLVVRIRSGLFLKKMFFKTQKSSLKLCIIFSIYNTL